MTTYGRPTASLAGMAAAGILVLGLSAAPAGAQSLVEHVTQSCKTELETYCSQVTPGENRVLACIYAHGDKLSGQCEKALYDAAAALERAINTIAYVANSAAPTSRASARRSSRVRAESPSASPAIRAA